MAFKPQQISPIDLNPNKAVGVNLPFNGPSVFKSNFLTKDSIKNNLINFLLTDQGERYLNPLFGGGIRSFIFEQINNDSLDGIKENVSFQIKQFFPSVVITSLNVLSQIDNNTIIIEMYYYVENTNINDNLTLEL